MSATLKSNNRFLTPLVDISRLSLLTIENVINNAVGSDSPVGESGTGSETHGDAVARYITRFVELESAASQVDVFAEIGRPTSNANVFGFIRFTENGEFVRLEAGEIPINDEGSVSEVRFNTSTTGTPDSFTGFQIKFVFVSTDSAIVPEMANMRAIATS